MIVAMLCIVAVAGISLATVMFPVPDPTKSR